MLIGGVNVDWGGVVFLGCFGLAVVVLLTNWVRNIVTGQKDETPAEVPALMMDAQPVTYVGNKKVIEVCRQDDELEVMTRNATDDFMLDPSYSSVPGNLFHQND